MKKIKYLSVCAFLIFFCGVNHANDQVINEPLFIGADDGQLGWGKPLYFGGTSENGGDPLWINRFDRGENHSDLRINIADDNGDDRFVVGSVFWQDATFHPYFVVQSNGRVGIGTEVIGDERLAVNGKIRAKEIKIEAATWDTPWPDYVFDKTHQLTSLNYIKSYIEQYHHLPEMPSAAEVYKNGIELGQMNKSLLKKLEELTLYLIEKDKQLQTEQKVNSHQQNLIKSLSQRLDKLEQKNN